MKYKDYSPPGLGYGKNSPQATSKVGKKLTSMTSPGVGKYGKPTIGVGGEKGSSGYGVGKSKGRINKKKVYSAKALTKAFTMASNPRVNQKPIKLGDQKGY